MTGIEKLREFVGGISPTIAVCGVTRTSYDREHKEEAWVLLRDFLADISDQIEDEQDVETVRSDAMEAWRWVRDHGGLSHVKDILHDFRAVVERLGIEWSESEESTVSEFIEAMRRLRALEEAGVSLDDEGNVIVRKTEERGE